MTRKLWAVVFAIFCAEIGLFLVIYPWTQVWESNYLLSLVPQWADIWFSGFFRGALSGLGLLNLYIAGLEIYRLKRFRPVPVPASS